MKVMAMMAALSALAGPGAAVAQQATANTDDRDARCVAALGGMWDQASDEDKPGLQAGAMYFAGRLSSHLSDEQVAAKVAAASKTLAGQELSALGSECSAELDHVGDVFDSIGGEE